MMHLMPKGRLKYVLAGIGVIYLLLFFGYLIFAAANRKTATGPSELELHPEKADEIRAKERADQLQDRLKLTDEQKQKVTEVFLKDKPMMGGPPPGKPGEPPQGPREEIAKILTPEQQALAEKMRPQGPGGRPGGPGGRGPGGPPGMNSERMDELKQAMTPEQKDRFDKQMERMSKMPRPPGPPPGGPGGPGGPPGGPGGPGGDGGPGGGGPGGEGGPGGPPPSQ